MDNYSEGAQAMEDSRERLERSEELRVETEERREDFNSMVEEKFNQMFLT